MSTLHQYPLWASQKHCQCSGGVQLAGPQCQGMAGDGLLATFTSCAIPIAGVLAYHLPGRESHSKSKMSPIEELAWKAVAHSI